MLRIPSKADSPICFPRAHALLHSDERHIPVSLKVLTLDSVSFAFALHRILAGGRIKLSAEMLQVMDKLMDHEAARKHRILVAQSFVDIDDSFIVVPTHRVAFSPATDISHKKTVRFEFNEWWNIGRRVPRKLYRPTQENSDAVDCGLLDRRVVKLPLARAGGLNGLLLRYRELIGVS